MKNILKRLLLYSTLGLSTMVPSGCINHPLPTASMRDNSKQSELENLLKGVVAIRQTAVYALKSDNSRTITRNSMGSGFVYKTENGHSYVMTARHVPDAPKELRSMFGKYVLKQNTLDVVDNRFDKDQSDDMSLDLVAKDSKNDVAILKANGILYTPQYTIGDSDSLRVGDKVVLSGYPSGLAKIISEGVIANPNPNKELLKKMPFGNVSIVNSTMRGGQSGTPFFRFKDGKYSLMGVCVGGLISQGHPTDYSLCVEINSVKDLMDVK